MVGAGGVIVGSWEAGVWDYRHLSEEYLESDGVTGKNGYTRYWDDTIKSPWLYSATDQVFIGYDDTESMEIRGNYVRDNNLKGVLMWDINSDSLDGALIKAYNAGVK